MTWQISYHPEIEDDISGLPKNMEPHGQSPWQLLLPPADSLRESKRRGLSADGLPEALPFGEHLAEAKAFSHSSTGKARGLLRRRIKQRENGPERDEDEIPGTP